MPSTARKPPKRHHLGMYNTVAIAMWVFLVLLLLLPLVYALILGVGGTVVGSIGGAL